MKTNNDVSKFDCEKEEIRARLRNAYKSGLRLFEFKNSIEAIAKAGKNSFVSKEVLRTLFEEILNRIGQLDRVLLEHQTTLTNVIHILEGDDEK